MPQNLFRSFKILTCRKNLCICHKLGWLDTFTWLFQSWWNRRKMIVKVYHIERIHTESEWVELLSMETPLRWYNRTGNSNYHCSKSYNPETVNRIGRFNNKTPPPYLHCPFCIYSDRIALVTQFQSIDCCRR